MHSPVSHHLIKYGSCCEEAVERILSVDVVGLHWPMRYTGNWGYRPLAQRGKLWEKLVCSSFKDRSMQKPVGGTESFCCAPQASSSHLGTQPWEETRLLRPPLSLCLMHMHLMPDSARPRAFFLNDHYLLLPPFLTLHSQQEGKTLRHLNQFKYE